MARYFKFKSAEDLTVAATGLGAEIRLSGDLSSLALPTAVAGRKVGNRIVYQPMEGCDGTTEGRPDELTYRRFQRFGAGGAKIVWGEAAAVVPEGRANPRQLLLIRPYLNEFRRLVDVCRSAHRERFGNDGDLLVGIQLTHSGRFSFIQPARVTACPVLDAPGSNPLPRLLRDDELDALADRYVEAATLAAEAGFDFVDVKQCHRYLMGELLAAANRDGKYGGAVANRVALACNVVQRIRDRNPDLLVAARINAYDGVPYMKGPGDFGLPRPHPVPLDVGFGNDRLDPLRFDLGEPVQAIRNLVAAGVCMVNVSAGCPYFNPHVLRPAEHPPVDGYLPPEHPLLGVDRHFRLTEGIQRAFPELPVVGSGYSFLQDYVLNAAAANVADGRTTFAGLGRAILAYPDIASDGLHNGRLDRKSICRTFSYCTNLMRNKNHPLGQYPTGCPPFDKEVYHAIYESAKR